MLRFDGRVVIVTGAGAGLGRAYALLFASRGASVIVNDLGGGRHGDGRDTKSADTVVAEIRRNGGKAVPNYDSVLDGEKIVKTAIDAFGRIDVVVNNAGILRDKSFMKMTEEDWDLVQNVHLKGSMKTTQAAWPYFRKQNYGRVILTTSNSGLYGNFGQANYSSAKMGLVGLANTLAIEGSKNNIHTNVIVPTAGSRLTEDIVPPDFYKQLKPELIAPVVFWLCHEKCTENGSIIESALGWAGKCHIVRASGSVLRQKLEDNVTPENVESNWSTITNMSNAKHYDTIGDVTGEFLNLIECLKNDKSNESAIEPVIHNYNYRDSILYALGVGATVQEPSDLRYLYENHEQFSTLPTFPVIYGPLGISLSLLENILKADVDLTKILHGEQYLELLKQLPTEGRMVTRYEIKDVLDKGKGATVLLQSNTYDGNTGEQLTNGLMTIFIVGAGGFGGKRTSSHDIPAADLPTRKPDISVTQKTNHDQAALYRLSGDLNPLHIDSNISSMAGYKRPILHGLCSLGFSVRHVLQMYADGDPNLFKAVKVRFAKPVLPGQTLRTDMWLNGNRIQFQTFVVEDNVPVITNAYVDLVSVKPRSAISNMCSGTDNLESDAIFIAIGEHAKANPETAKKLNAIFLYNITKDNATKAQWTLDMKNGEVYKGKPKSGKADTTLTLSDKDMVQLALGKLNPQVAFMQGKLKIAGNIMLAQKLKTLMDMNKPKL